MQVKLLTTLDDCPKHCEFADIESYLNAYNVFDNDDSGVMVTVTCKHQDVCKLVDDDS